MSLGIDGRGVGHRDLGRVAVEVVLGLLAHRERARERDLDPAVGVRAQELDVADLDGVAADDRADDPRHRVRMARAVDRSARVVDVDTVECGREAVRVALAALLAVGHDVDPGALHVGDRDPGRVVLGLLEELGLDPPELARPHPRRESRAEALAVDEPVRLRVAADDRGRKERQRHGCASLRRLERIEEPTERGVEGPALGGREHGEELLFVFDMRAQARGRSRACRAV